MLEINVFEKKQKRADYLLKYRRDFTLAVIEAKSVYKTPGEGLQQAKEYAEILGLKFAYSTNGKGIIEYDFVKGERGKADYGKKLIDRLATDLTKKFRRGFGHSNLFQMRSFYPAYAAIVQTLSGQLNNKSPSQIFQTPSGILQSNSGTICSRI